MDIFGVFRFLGGVALFLFGMHTMGAAIGREAGGLRHVLEDLTSGRLRSLALGTGVAAIVQSSAAVSVMVLGFLGSGIVALPNAVAAIMGANIGTCATAWILSLNSISGDAFFLRLLSPDSFVPVLAAVGAMTLLVSKSDRKKDAALILLGFSVLMYGMDFMSEALRPLTATEEFTRLLTLFSNPFVGIVIGFVIAVVTQSSSASVGILQAVAAVGEVRFDTALPILLGINIGATVIVVLSAVGGTRDVQRAALIALLYNVIGALAVQAAWSLADAVWSPALAGARMGYVSIAALHTGYKTLIAALLLPFTDALIALARRFIPDAPGEERLQLLDDLLLKSPAVAVGRCTELTNEMARLACENTRLALDLTQGYDEAAVRRVAEAEDRVDKYEDRLGTYMTRLSGTQLSGGDQRELARLLHCIGDFERLSDHALNLSETADELQHKGLRFSPAAERELAVMCAAVREIVLLTERAFMENDAALALQVEPLEEVIDSLTDQLKARHVARLQRGECTTLLGFILQDFIGDFERVADHCSNIAICVIQTRRSAYDAHGYINALMASDDPAFRAQFLAYQKKYALP